MPYSATRWPDDFPRTVVWTRGEQCSELAELLATGQAVRCESDPAASCLEHRADLAVMAKPGSFDVVATASPHEFDADKVRSVAAAVAGGPHSRLAAVVARRLAASLGIDGAVVSAYRNHQGRPASEEAIAEATAASGLPGTAYEVGSAAHLVERLSEDTLLVLGAPGGSWLHRQFFGPGTRLASAAPAGAVVVRSQPLRAYHRMSELEGLGRYLRVADARLIGRGPVHPVVDEGTLVGVVRDATLATADPEAEVGTVMEQVPFAGVFDALDELQGIEEFYDGAPVPIIDRQGRLVGGVSAERLDPEG
jgi:hypothetical protein